MANLFELPSHSTKIFVQIISHKQHTCCENTKSQHEAVIDHLVGRQGQPRRAQVHAMALRGQKGWSQNPFLPRLQLRVCSSGKSSLLEIPVCWRSSKGQ